MTGGRLCLDALSTGLCEGDLRDSTPRRRGIRRRMRRRVRRVRLGAFWVAAALAVAACGDNGPAEPEHEKRTDPSMARLAAACTEYWQTVLAQLPPRTHTGYSAYLRERQQHLERFLAAVRREPAKRSERARLLAAGSKILSQIDDIQLAVEDADFTRGLYHGTPALSLFDREFETAAKKARVPCAQAPQPSASLREFRRRAAEVCGAAGRPSGLPSRDAEVIRNRVNGHAKLPFPDTATELERDTLAAERELAEAAARAEPSRIIVDADGRYLALAARTTEGWSRQGVLACADLPTGA